MVNQDPHKACPVWVECLECLACLECPKEVLHLLEVTPIHMLRTAATTTTLRCGMLQWPNKDNSHHSSKRRHTVTLRPSCAECLHDHADDLLV